MSSSVGRRTHTFWDGLVNGANPLKISEMLLIVNLFNDNYQSLALLCLRLACLAQSGNPTRTTTTTPLPVLAENQQGKLSCKLICLFVCLSVCIFAGLLTCGKPQHQYSDSTKVTLRGLTVKSSGIYRCEVSAEAPSFDSVQAEGRMTIVRKLALPVCRAQM